MILSIQSFTLCLLFFIFYQKKVFQKLLKIVFISSIKYFSLNVLFFFLFFPVSRFKGPDQKMNFCKHVLQLKETGNQFHAFFVFRNLLQKKGLGAKKKIKLLFSWSLLKRLISKSLLHLLAILGHLPKLKRRIYGTSFYCRFFAYLFHKIFSLLKTLSNDQVSVFGESGLVG